MNEIKIYLKPSGSIAELYKDFNLYQGSYQNVKLSLYVPKSLLYQNEQTTFGNAIKTGAILTAPNGKKVTTESYYADYVKDEVAGDVEYSVYSQKLPKEYVVYTGTQTIVANVVSIDTTDENNPVILEVTTSQTAKLVVLESAYLSKEEIIEPDAATVINAKITALQEGKQNKLTAGKNINISEDYVISAIGEISLDWGSLVGDINNQTDLKNKLDAKADTNGEYPDLTAGHAIDAENDGTGNNIAEQFATVSSDIDGLREDITNESHFRGMFDSVEALRAAYPTATPNDYAYIVGGNQWIYQNGEWTDSEKPTPNTAVPRGTSIPLMDGIGSAGSSSAYASEDHRHPSDTNKVNKSGDTMTGALNAPATNTTKAVTKEVILSDPNDTAEIPTSGYQALTVDAKGVEVGEASVPLNLRGVTTRPVYTQNGATGRGLAFVNYGTCTSSSGMTTKEVVLPGFVLETGTRIYVKFTYSATIASSTVGTAFKLNVNNTGAKALFVNGANSSSFYPMLWKAGAICEFIYDGTNWNLIAPHILNSGYINTTSVTNITNANDTVTSYYRSSDGNSWYRKWASGWKECGGKITNGSGEFNYTLPLVFNSVNYNVIASFAEGGSSVVSLYGKPYTSQSMQIKKWYGGGAASEPCYYYACGY